MGYTSTLCICVLNSASCMKLSKGKTQLAFANYYILASICTTFILTVNIKTFPSSTTILTL